MAHMNKILDVKNLTVSFRTDYGWVQAVRGINFSLQKGETLAIVGESGCGKSVTAKALLKLLDPESTKITADHILFEEHHLNLFSDRDMRSIRGSEIAIVFQDPTTALNPTMKIGDQIAEGYLSHGKASSKKEALTHALHLLHLVKVPNPELRLHQYPHELSGGMKQRVVIAIALSHHPKIIIADEPTTALDVTIQAQIMQLLKEIQRSLKMSVIFITHDLSLVANFADRILVMYAGQIVEESPCKALFSTPFHPYTEQLLQSIPRLDQKREEPLQPIKGSPPSALKLFKGCPFASRCRNSMKICFEEPPPLFKNESQKSSCWLHDPRAKGEPAP